MTEVSTPLRSAALAAAAGTGSALFFAVSAWLPPLGLLACFASPLPLALAAWAAGAGAAGVGLAAGALVAGLLTGPVGSAVYAGQFGLGACVLGLAVRREKAPAAAVGSFAVVTTAAFWLVIAALGLQAGKGPQELVDETVRQSLFQARELLLRSSSDPAGAAAVTQWAERSGRFLTRTFAGLVLTFGILVAWANAVVLRRILARQGRQLSAWNTWRAGEHWIWLLIASGLAALLGRGALGTVGMNVFLPTVAVYFLQGLAVLQHLFETKALPGALRGVAYALLFVQFPLMLLVAAVGAFDLWVDFRSRWSAPPPTKSAET